MKNTDITDLGFNEDLHARDFIIEIAQAEVAPPANVILTVSRLLLHAISWILEREATYRRNLRTQIAPLREGPYRHSHSLA